MDLNFKSFVESFDSDIKATLAKIPKSYRDLIKGFKFKDEKNSTLTGDTQHVGEIDEKKKHIKVATSWCHSREFITLHEIAHAVWKYKVTDELKDEWAKIVKKTKEKQKQPNEELFAHSFASFYCKMPPSIHDHEEWRDFIKKLPK